MGAGSAHPDREFLFGWAAGERDIGSGIVARRDCSGIISNSVSWTAYGARRATSSGTVRRHSGNIRESLCRRGGSSDVVDVTGISVVVPRVRRIACSRCGL